MSCFFTSQMTKQGKLETLLDPNWPRMMPLPGLQIYRLPHVTLIFDLLTAKVGRFKPFPVITCANIVFTALITEWTLNRWISERTSWEHYATTWQSGLEEAGIKMFCPSGSADLRFLGPQPDTSRSYHRSDLGSRLNASRPRPRPRPLATRRRPRLNRS